MTGSFEYVVDSREVRELVPREDGSLLEVRSFVATAMAAGKAYAETISLPRDGDEISERALYEIKRMTIDRAVAGLAREFGESA